jgi:hypothetical protein
MNSLTDNVTKHVFSKANPTAVSRCTEILRELDDAQVRKSLKDILSTIVECYSDRFGRCSSGYVSNQFALLKKTHLLGKRPEDLDPIFAAGCYDDSFSPEAKYILINRLYVHSKVFRDYLGAIWEGEGTESEALELVVVRHSLNETARQKLSSWLKTLMLAEEFAGRVRPSVWLRRKSLREITLIEIQAALRDMIEYYEPGHLYSEPNFKRELVDRVFHGCIPKSDVDAVVTQLGVLGAISSHHGKEYKVFVQISEPSRLNLDMTLRDFIDSTAGFD